MGLTSYFLTGIFHLRYSFFQRHSDRFILLDTGPNDFQEFDAELSNFLFEKLKGETFAFVYLIVI